MGRANFDFRGNASKGEQAKKEAYFGIMDAQPFKTMKPQNLLTEMRTNFSQISAEFGVSLEKVFLKANSKVFYIADLSKYSEELIRKEVKKFDENACKMPLKSP